MTIQNQRGEEGYEVEVKRWTILIKKGRQMSATSRSSPDHALGGSLGRPGPGSEL